MHLLMPAFVRSTEWTLLGTVEVQLLWGGKVEAHVWSGQRVGDDGCVTSE